MTSTIRRLRADDAAALVSLRREALEREPLAFAASPSDDPGVSVEFVRTALGDADEQATFGAFEGGDLVGMVGVIRAREAKLRHQARVWGMYVAPSARRRGIGRALLAATIEHARAWKVVEQLHLTVATVVAAHLYETAGFRPWGREPSARRHHSLDESHLVLRLTLPALSTTRLGLASATHGDVDALWAIWRDPDVRRYLFDDLQVTRERAAEALESCLALVAEGLGLWTVRLHARASSVIGCVGLLRVTSAADHDPRLVGTVEPLAAFAPSVWGNGYAREALSAVLAYGFDSVGLAKMAAITDVPNEASDRMVRRVGFQVLGECDGPKYRLRTYTLRSEEFAAMKRTP